MPGAGGGCQGQATAHTYRHDGLRHSRQSPTTTYVTLHEAQDETLSREVGNLPGGGAANRSYHLDAQGSVGAVTDASQSTVTRYETDAWGNVLSGLVAEEPAIYGGGLGYWYDPDLALYYVKARWLDPATGRWLSVDPVESEARYTYVANQPTTRVDPTGEAAWSAWYEGYIAGPGRRLVAAGEAQIELLGTTALVQALGIWGVDEETSRPLIAQIISFLKRLGGSLLHAVSDFVSKLGGWIDTTRRAVSAGFRAFLAKLGRGMQKYLPPRSLGGIALWVLGLVVGIIWHYLGSMPIVQAYQMVETAFALLSNAHILDNLTNVLKEIALGPFNTLIESLSAAKDEGPYGNGFALAGLIFDVIGVVKSVRKSVRRLAQKTKVGAVPPPHASPRGDEGRDAEAIGTDDLVSANEALNQSGVKQELAKQPKTGKRKSDNGKGSPPHLRVHPRFGKPAAFGHATHVGDGDWRKTYEDAFGPEVAAEVVVHHAVPRQMQRLHPELISPAEEHSLENLRGIPKGANADLHLSKIRRTWNKFGSTHPKPTKQEILDFATQVDDQFGHLFRPPVR